MFVEGGGFEIPNTSFKDEDINVEFLLANFIRGLERKIQTELRVLDPSNKEEAI